MSSAAPRFYPLPYFSDSTALFEAVADRPWAVFLDSGFPYCRQGRYDFIAADPVCTLTTRGAITEIHTRDGRTHHDRGNPFALVKRLLQETPCTALADWPFCGGAIGYFAYDLARRLEKLPAIAENAEHIPEMMVGIYDWVLAVDHQRQRAGLITRAEIPQLAEWCDKFRYPAFMSTHRHFRFCGPVHCNFDAASYAQAFARIQAYLKAGDCYQVNLTQRFAAPCEGDPWAAYCALRQMNAGPFSAYLHFPGVQVLSSSPERFLKVVAGVVETKPIKGTRPRGADDASDAAQITALRDSEKDRAENLMIVDLLRNDISKCCVPGSVHVPDLFAIESYATVHHLVSTIRGRLAPEYHALDLLQACFPGGSITGAPKIRAMEIIEELEPHRRGVYCGAIGYIGYDGGMDSNIAIRTLVHSEDVLRFWAGGGIVHDSEMQAEYQECFDKAAALLRLIARLR